MRRRACAPGDVVLVKGSLGSRMAPIVEALQALDAGAAAARSTGNEEQHDALSTCSAPLADEFAAFNLFRYLTFRTGGAVVTALLISFVIGAALIRWLQAASRARASRSASDGPDSHLADQEGHADHGRGADPARARGRARCCGPISRNGYVWVVLLVTLGFGAVGFVDDYLKLTKRNSHGPARPAQAASPQVAHRPVAAPAAIV